jgi:hypothetical protein
MCFVIINSCWTHNKNILKSEVQVVAVAAAVVMGPQAGFIAYAALASITAATTTALTSGASLVDVIKARAIGFAAGVSGCTLMVPGSAFFIVPVVDGIGLYQEKGIGAIG